MSQHYYYNGTQLDDFNGSTGTLIEIVRHDSSPSVQLTETDVARGSGRVFRELQTRAKSITIQGAIVASSQADFEDKLDTLKALLTRPGKLKITNYGTTECHVSTFEEGEVWTGASSWDFTNYKIGRRAMKLTSTNAVATVATSDMSYDLSAFADTDTVKLWAYIDDATKLDTVSLRFETTVGTDYYVKTISSGFANGWNEFSILRSAFTTTGSPTWASISRVRLTALSLAAVTVNVSFDDLRLSTTTDSRMYDVALASDISYPREHYNVTWVPFSVTFSCSEGSAQSAITVTRTTPTDANAQRFVPLAFDGSGSQPVSVNVGIGSILPSRVVVADHFLDTFGSYANATAAAAVYTLTGTWTIGAHQAYLKTLRESTATGTVTAAIRNLQVQDGEIIAFLYRPTSSTLGVFARAPSEAPTLRQSGVISGEFGAFPGIFDGQLQAAGRTGAYFDRWWWVKLVCKGQTAELWYKFDYSDDWVRFFSGNVKTTGAGAWGIYANNTAIRCAYLEVTDYATGQTNTLTYRNSNITTDQVYLNTRTLLADSISNTVQISGSFPKLLPGFNQLSVAFPSSQLGAASFYDISSRFGDYLNFGGGTGGANGVRRALTFSSGTNTHIRQRGTWVYIGQQSSTADHGDIVIRLETTSAGLPTGTAVNDVNGNAAQVTISKYDNTSYVVTSPAAYNASLIPIEVVWAADIPVSASTTYALVFSTSTGTLPQSWYIPVDTTSSTGLLSLCTAPAGGAWASTASKYGFAILEGNDPVGAGVSPSSVVVSHRATFL